jgi:hypothetical protein
MPIAEVGESNFEPLGSYGGAIGASSTKGRVTLEESKIKSTLLPNRQVLGGQRTPAVTKMTVGGGARPSTQHPDSLTGS